MELSLFLVDPLLLLRQCYACGNPVAQSLQGRGISTSGKVIRDLLLRQFVSEKRILPVMVPRIRIPQYHQRFDPLPS